MGKHKRGGRNRLVFQISVWVPAPSCAGHTTWGDLPSMPTSAPLNWDDLTEALILQHLMNACYVLSTVLGLGI